MTCGIYQIINTINGKIYIGSSINIEKRWVHHRILLRKNKHHSQHLQNAWNKYTGQNFKIEILEITLIEDRITKEQHYLDTLQPFGDKGYNCNHKAVFQSDEARRKMALTSKGRPPPNKGKPMSKEQKAKISKALTGRRYPDRHKPLSKEHKEKISNGLKGHSISEETKEKIRKTKTGSKQSEEAKRKQSIASKGRIPWNKGIPTREETKEKLRIALSGPNNYLYGKPATEQMKKNLDQTGRPSLNKGKPLSEDTKEKLRIAMTGRHHSEETRAKISEISKAYWEEKKKAIENE